MACTAFALCYVHQEVEIVKTSFFINKRHKKVSFLLDQYRSLVYNLSQLESPTNVEETLCVNEIVLCMPRIGNIRHADRIDLAYSTEETAPERNGSFLSGTFDRFSTKAEAKVVK